MGVPFSFFCSLIREISKLRPSPSKSRRTGYRATNHLDYPALRIFRRWVDELRRRFAPLPPNTTLACFHFLFPDEDVHRKYGIQESRMTHLLANCFGLDVQTFDKWSLEEATGCLGQELKLVLERTCSYEDDYESPLSIADINTLLDELSEKSGYTHASIRSKFPKTQQRRPRDAIFRSLFRQLTPQDASVLVQIILKDIRPLLYPLTEFHYSTALTKFDSASVKTLSKEHAMQVWDASGMFLRFYRVCADMYEAAAFADSPHAFKATQTHIGPTLGKPIAIPKSEKARGCEHALHFFTGSERVWAETKYDGERAQIHVQVTEDGSSDIFIFSKSKRDSTLDRHAVHVIIREALGLNLGTAAPKTPKIKQNVILDAEMVAFRGEIVDEFWRIRQLIRDSAYGIRASNRWTPTASDADEHIHESMDSLLDEGLSLGLVFFDILFLDSESLLSRSYAERRELLESLFRPSPGKAILAKRYLIDMMTNPCKRLYRIFSEHIATCQEGLVLKAEDSRYNDYRKPWVKVKRDYLPNAGDKLNLVIVGAAWEKVRGRSLRVPPSTYTTFYLGAIESAKERIMHHTIVPNFHVYFTVSYGLKRDELEKINFVIKSSDPIPYSSLDRADLPFKVDVFNGLKPPPSIILRQPLLVSLYGAGFTKAPRCPHYELRFPRITKYYLPNERLWQESSTLEDVHKIALESIGRDRSDKDISDWANVTWGKLASPKANCANRRKLKTEYWERRLAQLDGKSVPPVADVKTTPTRRKHSENDESSSNSRSCIRRRTDSQPLSIKTNVIEAPLPIQIFTPPKSPELPPKPPWEVISDSALVWFAQPASKIFPQSCFSMVSWKKRIARERRLHSLDSLLLGCTSGIQEGIIVIDECNAAAAEKWTRYIRDHVDSSSIPLVQPIVVMFPEPFRSSVRALSTTTRRFARAVVYATNGDPAKVLRVLTYPNIPSPPPNSVNINFLLSPINPADINVVEGVYPIKPKKADALALDSEEDPVIVAGNEGLARVTAVGQGVHSLNVNDWVVMIKSQAGTWASDRNVAVVDVAKIPDADSLTEVQAATLMINPPTAYNMLRNFVDLQPGDWIIQNGANSAAGQAVIQIAAARGLKTINCIRNRPDFAKLKQKLQAIGATHVLTYDDLEDKAIRERVKEWVGSKPIRLGLNCIGGKETTAMARLLANDAHLVSYGSMSKQPLSIPVSLFIFKNLTCHGYWLRRWYSESTVETRENLMAELVSLIKEKKLVAPEHETVTITEHESDEAASKKIRNVIRAVSEGNYGKKVLLRVESKDG